MAAVLLAQAALLLSLCALLRVALAEPAMDRGTDRLGWDMAGSPFDSPSSAACQSACSQQPACVSWAFTRSQCRSTQKKKLPGCRLKFALAGPQQDDCSDSGWLPERMRPRCAETHYHRWPASQRTLARLIAPIPRTSSLLPAVLASNCSVSYCRADTWYCAWAQDDTLRCLYEDGAVNDVVVNGHKAGQAATAGVVTVSGQHPFELRLHNASTIAAAYPGYDGRFVSANAYQQGVWYVASAPRNDNSNEVADCGGHCLMGPLGRFQLSYDGGRSFTAASSSPLVADNLWLQDSGHRLSRRIRYGEMHVVDLGREGHRGGVEDGYTYLVGHGSEPQSPPSWLLWNQADAVFLARVKLNPDSVNEPEAWQFWAGDALQWLPWAERGVERAVPLLLWPNHTGSVSISFVPAIRRYLMLYTTPHTANAPLAGSDLLLLESRALTGPYQLVDQWDNFGPTAYFPTLPSKFISGELQRLTAADADNATAELQLWLAFSTLNDFKELGDPPYSAYAWNLLSIKLRLSQAAYDELQHDSRLSPPAALALLLSCAAIVLVLWRRPAARMAVLNLTERVWKLRRAHRYALVTTHPSVSASGS